MQQLYNLVGLSKPDAETKYKTREHLYLEKIRVDLFLLANNLFKKDSESLLV